MKKTVKGKVGNILLIYSTLFWGVILVSSIEFRTWFIILFVIGLLGLYTMGTIYFVKKQKTIENKNHTVFYRATPTSEFWIVSPLLIWFTIEVLMGNELRWMYVGGIIYLIGFHLLGYILDKKFQLQKIIITPKELIILEKSETRYDWDWLKGNCTIENGNLIIDRRWMVRNKYRLDKYWDKDSLIKRIRERIDSK